MRSPLARACLVLAAAIPCVASRARAEGDSGANGANVVRIETEAKLVVPPEVTEDVWTWLSARYRDTSFLDRDGRRFTAKFGDESFIDRYFDSPDLAFLATQSGVRHRTRIVKAGPAAAKDGRQLVQLKLNRNDAEQLERSEIKFEVDPPPGPDAVMEKHLLELVDRDDFLPLAERIEAEGVHPATLRPVLTVEQHRRRVYVADQHGPFATITLDTVSCSGWWQEAEWTEVELELNEIRYTEASPERRASMDGINDLIESDLVDRFPALHRDQTPKYSKAFALLEAGMPLSLPLRRLIAWRLSPADVLLLGLLVVLALAGGIAHLITRPRGRDRAQGVVPERAQDRSTT